MVPEYHNRFVPRRWQGPHPYYLNLPRYCNSWFQIHFHGRNIQEECRATRLTPCWPLFVVATTGRHAVEELHPPENVLAIGLYRLAPGGSFDNVGIVTNVGKATDVVNALYDFRNGVIKFPLTKPRQELPSQRSNNYVIYET